MTMILTKVEPPWPQRLFSVDVEVKVCDAHVAALDPEEMRWRIERAIAAALEADGGPVGVTWCSASVKGMRETAAPATEKPESSR